MPRFEREKIRAVLEAGPWPARKPTENLADLEAQIAANRAGAKLLDELVASSPRFVALAVATGSVPVEGHLPVGEVVERASRMLEAGARRDGVPVDDVSAGLLPARFILDEEAGTTWLRQESAFCLPGKQYYLGFGRRHGTPAPASRYRTLASLRRLLG